MPFICVLRAFYYLDDKRYYPHNKIPVECLKINFAHRCQYYLPTHYPYPYTPTTYPTSLPTGRGGGRGVYITHLPTLATGGGLARRTVLAPKFSKNFRRFQKGSPHFRLEDIICNAAYYIICDIMCKM